MVSIVSVLGLLGFSPAALGEVPGWRPAPATNPLEFGSLRLEPAFALAPAEGEWEASFVVSEFNLWNHTWHTFATHRARDLYRQPVTDEELRYIERDFAGDRVWHLDLEGWRTDLTLSRGLAGGRSVTLRIPWIEIGSPHWDRFGEEFHELFGLTSLEREVFPRGETLVYIKDRDNRHIIEARDELERKGIGDVSIALGIPLRPRWGAEHRLVAALEAPTGKEGTLHGSGGWDASLQWFAVWTGDRKSIRTGAGATFLDPNGSFLGEERAHLFHLYLQMDRHLWRRVSGTFGVRIDGSPLWSVIHELPGYPSTIYRFGLVGDLGTSWVAFDFDEELHPQTGVEADWAFHLSWGRAF
ncbi:MAG TPA: DUF3187 family protein [Thermoanaerobaculia bacterium]|nr:DUF3187 family protein [Thermoanaerobaculia bacterium]